MPVVSGQGLIGKIARVSDNRAVVKLITNRDFTVGAKVNGKAGSLATVSGTGDERKLKGQTIEERSPIAAEDLLVTSGVDRSPYPGNIPIGKVTNVIDNGVDLDKVLEVELIANLSDLEYVTVLLYTPKEQ
jgi:cell shape-determining protein MreC